MDKEYGSADSFEDYIQHLTGMISDVHGVRYVWGDWRGRLTRGVMRGGRGRGGVTWGVKLLIKSHSFTD